MFVNGARDSSADDTPVLLLRRIRTQFPASTTRQLTTTYNSSPRGVRCLWTLWEPALTHTSPHTCTRSETNLCKTFFILICFFKPRMSQRREARYNPSNWRSRGRRIMRLRPALGRACVKCLQAALGCTVGCALLPCFSSDQEKNFILFLSIWLQASKDLPSGSSIEVTGQRLHWPYIVMSTVCKKKKKK